MPYEVFVSHSSKDKAAADAVVAFLERDGMRCWVAPRDIIAGRSWANSIMEAIKECRVMVVIFSSNANHSDHVGREIERAISHGLAIIPVRIENVMPAGDLEFFLSSPHWMDAITPPLERHLEELAAKVRVLLSLPQSGPRGVVPQRRSSRTAILALVALVAMIGVGIIAAVFIRGKAAENPLQKEFLAYQEAIKSGSTEPFLQQYAPIRFDAWLAEANKGNPIAELFVARCYETGVGTTKDLSKGLKWAMLSASQNNSYGMNLLGNIYQDGLGTEKDRAKALEWYSAAAQLGNQIAMFNMGNMFNSNDPGTGDYVKAMDLFSKSAALGDADSMAKIADLHDAGHGVPKSLDQAVIWYRKAAQGGNSYAVGKLLAKRLGPSLMAYAATDAADSIKSASLVSVQNALPDFKAADLKAEEVTLEDWDVKNPCNMIAGESSSDQMLEIRDSMIEQYMTRYEASSIPIRSTHIIDYSDITYDLVKKWFDKAQEALRNEGSTQAGGTPQAGGEADFDKVATFWHLSYDGLVLTNAAELQSENLIHEVEMGIISLLNVGKRDEGKDLLAQAGALSDKILTDTPWNWYATTAIISLYFDSGASLSRLGEPELSQQSLHRAWALELKRTGRPDLLDKYNPLPLRDEVPAGATADDTAFFSTLQKVGPGKDSYYETFVTKSIFDGVEYPFYLYIVSGSNGYADYQDQVQWLQQTRGGDLPQALKQELLLLNNQATPTTDFKTLFDQDQEKLADFVWKGS